MSWRLWSKPYTQQWEVEGGTRWSDVLYQSLSPLQPRCPREALRFFTLIILFKLQTGADVLLTAYLKMISVYIVIIGLWFHGSISYLHLLFHRRFFPFFLSFFFFEGKRSNIAKEQNTRRGHTWANLIACVNLFQHQNQLSLEFIQSGFLRNNLITRITLFTPKSWRPLDRYLQNEGISHFNVVRLV